MHIYIYRKLWCYGLRATSYPTCLDHFYVFQVASKHVSQKRSSSNSNLLCCVRMTPFDPLFERSRTRITDLPRGQIPKDLRVFQVMNLEVYERFFKCLLPFKIVLEWSFWIVLSVWKMVLMKEFRRLHQTPGSEDAWLQSPVVEMASFNTICVRQTDTIWYHCTNMYQHILKTKTWTVQKYQGPYWSTIVLFTRAMVKR